MTSARWTVTDLDTTLGSALDAERRTLEFYDRFLYSVSELEVRNVFLRLRYHVADSTIPLIEDTVEPEA